MRDSACSVFSFWFGNGMCNSPKYFFVLFIESCCQIGQRFGPSLSGPFWNSTSGNLVLITVYNFEAYKLNFGVLRHILLVAQLPAYFRKRVVNCPFFHWIIIITRLNFLLTCYCLD